MESTVNIHQPPSRGKGKIFMHGRSQAVRLPKEFRLPGTEVRITRRGDGILIEPLPGKTGVRAWLAELAKYKDEPFMEEGREQPPMPENRVFFDDPE
jgi:antitoxin VapB